MSLVDKTKVEFKERVEEIDAELALLASERSDLVAVLRTLGVEVGGSSNDETVVREFQGAPIVSGYEPRKPPKSVRAAVEEILQQSGRAFTPIEMTKALVDSGHSFDVSDLLQSVRSALWQLRDKERAVNMGQGSTIHVDHANLFENAESPA